MPGRRGCSMKLMQALHDYLQKYFPVTLWEVPYCTCGDANHVRVLFFRVNGQPATAVIPEEADLTPQQFAAASGCFDVRPLAESELEGIFPDTELGRLQLFDNPFGTIVYFDESLLLYPSVVMCPRMFGGKPGECFRVPTRHLLDKTRAVVLRLVPDAPRETSNWAV